MGDFLGHSICAPDTIRYADDLIVFNNKKFLDYVKEIYPSQLTVKKALRCMANVMILISTAGVVLCCVVLCCVVLCCVVLCCVVLCCAVLCCAVLCCAVLPIIWICRSLNPTS